MSPLLLPVLALEHKISIAGT